MCNITIDGAIVAADEQWSVLDAARAAGIDIPGLCGSHGCADVGVCRLCMVEIEGQERLQPACSTSVREGLAITTSTERIRAMRRTAADLLLREHAGVSPGCTSEEHCEVHRTAARLASDHIPKKTSDWRRTEHRPLTAIFRNPAKCIECRRCLQECSRVHGAGTIAGLGLGEAESGTGGMTEGKSVWEIIREQGLMQLNCVQCGHCTPVCPVDAVGEKDNINDVWRALADPRKHVVVQTAPAIRASLGECFGNPPGTLVTGKVNTALRRLGFDAVFETNFAADLTIMEEGTELLGRIAGSFRDGTDTHLPLLTSCCPGWINFAENTCSDLLPHVSTCKSPQQMMGALSKTYYAEREGIDPNRIVTVAVMPCTAKKTEAERPEHRIDGMREVDYVLTTRDLATMIKTSGFEFASLPDTNPDIPFGTATGAGDIFATSGGVTVAALRTAFWVITGRTLPGTELELSEVDGLPGVRSVTVLLDQVKPDWAFLEGVELSAAVAQGLGNAQRLLEAVRNGDRSYAIIEIMTCPGGCIGGGGQPRPSNSEIRAARREAIFTVDRGKTIRASYDNPHVRQLYEEFLGEPNGARAHALLHTPRGKEHPGQETPRPVDPAGVRTLT